jgi:FimV-like protein
MPNAMLGFFRLTLKLLAFLPGAVWSVEILEIRVDSLQGQPLSADVVFFGVDPVEDFSASIGNRIEFEQAGVPYYSITADVSASLLKSLFGETVLKLTTDAAVYEPELTILLALSDGKSNTNKVVNISLAGSGSSVLESNDLSLETNVSEDRETRLVRPNETLWSIADGTRESLDITVQQQMLAIIKLNPSAFIGENINSLKSGYLLVLPKFFEATLLSVTEAIDQATSLFSEWSGNIRRLRESNRPSSVVERIPKIAPINEPQNETEFLPRPKLSEADSSASREKTELPVERNIQAKSTVPEISVPVSEVTSQPQSVEILSQAPAASSLALDDEKQQILNNSTLSRQEKLSSKDPVSEKKDREIKRAVSRKEKSWLDQIQTPRHVAAITAGVLILLIISMLLRRRGAQAQSRSKRKPAKKLKNVPIVEEPVSATDNSNDNEKSDDSAEDVGIKTDVIDEEAQVDKEEQNSREISDDQQSFSRESDEAKSVSDESAEKVSHEEVVQTVQDSVSVQPSQSGNLSDEESGSEEVLQSEETYDGKYSIEEAKPAFSEEESPELGSPSEDEESDTRLKLAVAFKEAGDIEGAIELLEEVLVDGNSDQSETARSLLAELRIE